MIEQQLERIAAACEETNRLLAKALGNISAPSGATAVAAVAAAQAPATTTRAAKKSAGMDAPKNVPAPEAQPEHDPFAQENAEQPAITLKDLEEKLRKHAAAYGTATTLALMVKHGADHPKTTIKSVPTASYIALATEMDADLAKAPKK